MPHCLQYLCTLPNSTAQNQLEASVNKPRPNTQLWWSTTPLNFNLTLCVTYQRIIICGKALKFLQYSCLMVYIALPYEKFNSSFLIPGPQHHSMMNAISAYPETDFLPYSHLSVIYSTTLSAFQPLWTLRVLA